MWQMMRQDELRNEGAGTAGRPPKLGLALDAAVWVGREVRAGKDECGTC